MQNVNSLVPMFNARVTLVQPQKLPACSSTEFRKQHLLVLYFPETPTFKTFGIRVQSITNQ